MALVPIIRPKTALLPGPEAEQVALAKADQRLLQVGQAVTTVVVERVAALLVLSLVG